MKIVINNYYGGFGLSHEAVMRYAEIKKMTIVYDEVNDSYFIDTLRPENYFDPVSEIKRNDPALVQVVEEMGEKAWGKFTKLKIVEIPDDVQWQIEEYDGNEWVAEKHRKWY